MKNIIVIAGATASGKSRLAAEISKRIGGEVVSADSMQIYKHMDIGTAKPDAGEMDGVKHHMLSVADPTESYSAMDFAEGAKKCIDDIISRGKLPVVAGGTGMYLDVLTGRMKLDAPACDENVRNELTRIYENEGRDALYDIFLKEAAEYKDKIHKNDIKRVMRAIERARSGFDRQENEAVKEYNSLWFAIDIERNRLYNRINERVDIMLEKGLVDEVSRVILPIRDSCTTAKQAIGYKEVLLYLDNEITYDEMAELIKKRSRNYAKRQLTWFRSNSDIHWLGFDNAADEAIEIIKEKGLFTNENSN